MSYIHEALKKAQREKDLLAGGRGNIGSSYRYRPRIFRREWLVPVGLVLVAVVALSLSWSDLVHKPSSPKQAKEVVRQPALKPSSAATKTEPPRPPLSPGTGASASPATNTNRAAPPVEEGKRKEQKSAESVPKGSEPDKATVLYGQALALQKQGRLQEGKKLYEAALEHSPELVSALNNLGAIYIKEENYPAASKAFEKAIRIKPGYVDPYYNLACLHALQNDVGRSLFYLKKAISIDQGVREWASTDKDLENLHGHSEYEKIIQAPEHT